MAMNECEDDVPDNIVLKTKEAGCTKCPKYVYKDSEYRGKLPAASIGCQVAARFMDIENAEEKKVDLGDGWEMKVIWQSRSGTNIS